MIDYGALLTSEQRRNILEQRLAQFAAEAYQHSLNKQVALATGSDESAAQADEAIAILENAIEIHQTELNSLPASE